MGLEEKPVLFNAMNEVVNCLLQRQGVARWTRGEHFTQHDLKSSFSGRITGP